MKQPTLSRNRRRHTRSHLARRRCFSISMKLPTTSMPLPLLRPLGFTIHTTPAGVVTCDERHVGEVRSCFQGHTC